MHVYFSCSLTGGRADQPAYAALVDYLLAQGHTVPTAVLARPEVMDDEAVVAPLTVYQRDIAWLDAADALIAEVSTPSHGVGYEIAYALLCGKPVLALARVGVRVSKMLTGNTHPGLSVRTYADDSEARTAIADFLEALAHTATG